MIAALHKPKAESRKPKAATAFTLTELLVAMAIIGIIAAITVVGVGTLARDAKLASATNTVIAALDTARGIAIRDNKLTVLVFRPRVDGNKQYVELVIAQWTGETPTIMVQGSTNPNAIDRFVPIAGIASRPLPKGIKVAGPYFGSVPENRDHEWQTQSHFPAPGESQGYLLGVMYAGDGTVVTRNAVNDSNRMYIDFNQSGVQDVDGVPALSEPIDYDSSPTVPSFLSPDLYNIDLFRHWREGMESYVGLIPFLAIFDDDRCRAEYDVSEWNDPDKRTADYTQYITNNADRIHFNRYTGVVMR